MKLWIVRHATPLIASGICYGALDISADETHTRQTASVLAQNLPAQSKVWVSPLKRCMQLAEAVSDMRSELTLRIDDRLREMDFGRWEGVAWDAIPLADIQVWNNEFGAHRFGGVESANEVLARVSELWDAALEDVDPYQVWITHAGVARAVQLLSQGIRSVQSVHQWPKDAPGYGEWYCFNR